MRALTAIQGCIALLVAFLWGPFTHLHPAIGSDEYRLGEEHGAIIHSHISFDLETLNPSDRTIVTNRHGAKAQAVSVFDFQKANQVPEFALTTFVLVIPTLAAGEIESQLPDAVAHAPPGILCSGLRSPPA